MSYYRLIAVDDVGRESAPAALCFNPPLATGAGRRSVSGIALCHHRPGHIFRRRPGPVCQARRADAICARSPVVWAMGVAGLMCVAVLVPGIGTSVNGARRWLRFGPVQLQPSELAKWVSVHLPRLVAQPSLGGRPPVLPRLSADARARSPALCLLVVIQDFGTAVLIALCALTMLLAGRVKLWHLLVILLRPS